MSVHSSPAAEDNASPPVTRAFTKNIKLSDVRIRVNSWTLFNIFLFCSLFSLFLSHQKVLRWRGLPCWTLKNKLLHAEKLFFLPSLFWVNLWMNLQQSFMTFYNWWDCGYDAVLYSSGVCVKYFRTNVTCPKPNSQRKSVGPDQEPRRSGLTLVWCDSLPLAPAKPHQRVKHRCYRMKCTTSLTPLFI